LRLGILIDRLGPATGGAEAHTRALVRRALETGDDVVLATLDGASPDGAEAIRIEAPRGRPERDETFARDGVVALREAGCAVVYAIRHAHSCDVFLPHGGLVDDARDAKDRAAGGVGLATRVGRAFSRKHAFFQRTEQALLGSVEGPLVIAVADWIAGRIRRRHPACAERVVTVRNGVDAEHFVRGPFLGAGAELRRRAGFTHHLVGLLLARHPVLKGAEAAVAALAEPPVRDLERPFALLVAGGPLPRRLRRLARRLGVADRVYEIGPLADPRPAYAAADVLLHPTFYDPCSLVCLEALAMGLPVITTPHNGAREVMGQRGGIVVEEAGNPDALAFAIRVLADDDLRAVTADDARYLAMHNRERTRLDRILHLCRHGLDAQDDEPTALQG
jgi:UDP-glucose:(heptosyl)LPS alpha-1,3-glucosyltransferase